MNNVVRTAIEALAAVLGGTQSLHTNALDEVLALPTEEAAKLALRTQQIIAHETGVPDVIDPLGGSYFLETLTDRMEELAEAEFARILAMGEGSMLEGVLTGIERGVFQQAIAESAFAEQERFERGDLVKVGVTDFVEAGEQPIEILEISGGVETSQVDRVRDVRERRDGAASGPRSTVWVSSPPRTPTSSSRSSTALGPCAPRARSWGPCGRCSARTRRRLGSSRASES